MSVVDTLIGTEHGRVMALPVDQVRPSDDNVRTDLGDVSGLATSIKQYGLLQPIVVYPSDGDGYDLVAGHRRLAAHLEAGLSTIDAIVRPRPDDDADTTAARLIENLHRDDLSVADEARAFRALHTLGWSQRKIAEQVGVNQSHVSKRTALTVLPDDLLAAVDGGDVSIEQALAWIYLHRHNAEDAAQLLEVWRSGNTYVLGHQLDQAVRRCKDAEARTKTLAEATAKAEAGTGPPLADIDMSPGSTTFPALRSRGIVYLPEVERHGATREQLQADGTLAVIVDARGNTVEVCTDVARYQPPPRDDDEDDPPGGMLDRMRAFEDANTGRRDFLIGMLSAPDHTPPPAHVALVRTLRATINFHTSAVVKAAAVAIGVDDSGSSMKVADRIIELIDVDRPDNAVIEKACRAAEALLLARQDWGISMYGRPDDDVRAHMAALQDAGYELSDVEADWLQEDDTE